MMKKERQTQCALFSFGDGDASLFPTKSIRINKFAHRIIAAPKARQRRICISIYFGKRIRDQSIRWKTLSTSQQTMPPQLTDGRLIKQS